MNKLMKSRSKSRMGAAKKLGLLLVMVSVVLPGISPLYAVKEVVLDWESVPPKQEPTQVFLHGVMHYDSLVDPSDLEQCINCHYRKYKSKTRLCVKRCMDDPGAVHHPVFKKYPPDRKEAEYFPVAKLEKGGIIKFQNGTITCLSCHDVANNIPYHLVMDNRESRFCKLCHNIR
jgi:hypothetical protein